MRDSGCILLLGLVFGSAPGLEAQQDAAAPRLGLGLRGSHIPLYEGDATVGALSNWAVTLQGSVLLRPNRSLEAEAFYTLSPADDDPYHRVPRLQMAGAVLSFRGRPVWTIVPLLSAGLGILDVQPSPEPLCAPPDCFAEGGPGFKEARYATAIGGVGLDVPVTGVVHLRADLRIHNPVGADENAASSAERRTEWGVGVRVMF